MAKAKEYPKKMRAKVKWFENKSFKIIYLKKVEQYFLRSNLNWMYLYLLCLVEKRIVFCWKKMWPVFDRCNVYKSEISQQETLEHISTIAGSLAESLGTMSQVYKRFSWRWVVYNFRISFHARIAWQGLDFRVSKGEQSKKFREALHC